MRSKISFFRTIATVFAHDVKRWWPLTAAYTLVWLLILPLSRLAALANGGFYSMWFAQYHTTFVVVFGGIYSALLSGILFAMAAFSYLGNPRATNGLHALPARRGTLYATHCLAGLLSQLVPQAVCVLLTGAVLASNGTVDKSLLVSMMLALALPTLFFYFLGVFCMALTGQILAAPIFYAVLNVLVVGVESQVRGLAGNFYYGWDEPFAMTLQSFSPFFRMLMSVRPHDSSAEETALYAIDGVNWLWLYAAVGLVLALLGLLVYCGRHSEATGSIVAVGWARPVFRFGVSLLAALVLGRLLYYWFFGRYRVNGDYSLPGTLACMAAAGLVGCFAAEMLIKKSFRVWKSGWKGAVAAAAVLGVLGLAFSLDIAGFESYVPKPRQIQAVSVDLQLPDSDQSIHAWITDAEAIRTVTAAHRAVAGDKKNQLADGWYESHAESSGHKLGSADFSVEYRLEDGKTVRRTYSGVTLCLSEESDPATPAGALEELYNTPEAAQARALGREDPPDGPTKDLRFEGGRVYLSRWMSENTRESQTFQLTPAQARRIYDAIRHDASAGRTDEPLGRKSASMQGFIELNATCYDSDYSELTGGLRRQVTFKPIVTLRMTETIEVLREAGIEPRFS